MTNDSNARLIFCSLLRVRSDDVNPRQVQPYRGKTSFYLCLVEFCDFSVSIKTLIFRSQYQRERICFVSEECILYEIRLTGQPIEKIEQTLDSLV